MTSWLATIASDPAAILFLVAVVVLIGTLLGVGIAGCARRRKQRAQGRLAPETADGAAIARWVEEGRQLFDLWQERVEGVNELQGRLAEMAQEIGRLNQQAQALSLERDQLRTVVMRIGELIQQASEARAKSVREAGPRAGP